MDNDKLYEALGQYAEAHLSLYFKRILPHSEEHTPRSAHLTEGLHDTLMMLVLLVLRDISTILYEMGEDVNAIGCALEAIKKEYCGE